MRPINRIVIHCSATQQGKEYSVDTIREWHKKRGFSDIGYHFIIHLDGTIEKGRPIEKPGAHAKGYNSDSVGICYIGGLSDYGKPKDTRTVAQLHALRRIVDVLKILYDVQDENINGHRDLSVDLNEDGVITPDEWMKECPCFDVNSEL